MRARLILAVLILWSVPTFAAITGTVINADGQAVAGAKVTSFALESVEARRVRLLSADPARKALATAQSDSKGNFSIEAPKGSVVDLRIEAAGFAPQSERAAADDDAGVIELMPASMKQATVTANGKPVAGATVIVAQEDDESIATTDASGHYSLPDPARVSSRVIVRHPDYAVGNQAVGRFSTQKIDIALDAGSPLTGRVVAEDGQTGVANATVFVDELAAARSGEDGTFTIAHMPKKWELLEVRADNRIASRAFAKDLKAPLQLKLAKGASLSGTVRDAKTQLPVTGAEVRLYQPQRMSPLTLGVTAITDAKGNYSFSGIAGGDYDVMAMRPNYAVGNLSVHLTAGQAAQKTLYGTPLGRISGTVVDEDKRGVAAARIEQRQVSSGDGGPMFTRGMRMIDRGRSITAPDGHFLVRVDLEGELQLEAVKKGMPSGRSSTLKIAPGERRTGVVIALPHGVAITGRVIDSKGKPVAGVGIAASETRTNGGGPGMVRRMIVNNIMRGADEDIVRSSADGTFSLRVKEGTYDVGFKREGYAGKTLRAQQVSASSKPLEVTLEPGVEVSGRVTRAGAPVEGVQVIPIMSDAMTPVQTGPDGTFRISDLSPGEMMIAFSKREEFIQQTRAVTAPATDVNVDLPAGGRITGRVADKNSHAPVTAFEAGVSQARSGGGMVMIQSPTMQSFTSDDGTFVLENVPAGPLTLSVNAPGYVQARVPGITVEAGKTVENVEVSLETGVRVTGHVTGPDGAPAGGAMVRIDPMAGSRMMRGGGMNDPYTVADPNGEYTLENVEPGEKTLVFSRTGLISTSKTVTLSGDHAQVDAQLSSGVHTTGIVVNDAGTPIADAQVRASSAADPGFRSARTDASGTFTFDGLAPGRYEFNAGKDGYADAIMRDVDVTAAGTIRLTLKSGGVITGHVSGLSDTELQNASVMANSPNGNASAPVDSTGAYRIEGAPTGTVRVTARAGGMMTSSHTAPPKSVQVTPGSAVTVDFDFSGDITVKGRITRNGQPVAGARVSFSTSGGRFGNAMTDGNGHYEMTGLDEGKYGVTINDPSRGLYVTTYTVSGSDTFDVDMHGVTVRGRVIDTATGAPVDQAGVTLRKKDMSTGGVPVSTVITDAGGNFSFDLIPAGAYKATAEKGDYGSATTDVTVGDNGADAIELQLTPSQGIVLTVVDARDPQQRPLNAWYHAISTANGTTYDDYVRMASSAEPVKIPLPAGSFLVTVGAQGYAQRTRQMTSPGAQTVGLTPGGTIVVSSTMSNGTRVRLTDSLGQNYNSNNARVGGYVRGAPSTPVEQDPLQSTLQNVAAGVYKLDLLDNSGAVLKSTQVTVTDGATVVVRL